MDEVLMTEIGARPVVTDTDPEEMVLPEEAERRLGWIADWLNRSPHLAGEWGLGRYIDGGFRVLFRGPSGAGKSMAAVALARGSGHPLLRIDLGPIVSRYSGETERNLKAILDDAKEQGAILLFDEADALFAGRTEVGDSHDRYADIEIAYLLRRLEAFDGLAIVATNDARELDHDVVSRVDVIVDFPMPAEAAREQLWGKILGAVKMPKSDDVDAGELAREYALSGAEILRSTRLAAMRAASADKPIDMNLLKCAASERVAMRRSG
ncbi:MAG: ATP-binding protein [Myxococcales bacterium]